MITLQKIKDFIPSQEQIRSVELVLLCKAYVDTIKPIVEGYQKKILKKHKFRVSDDNLRDGKKSFIILNPDHSYLMSDSDFKVYLDELHNEHLNHGFNVKKDYCPLLIAKSNLRDAEKLMVDLLSDLTGIKWQDILRLEDYDKIVDLCLSFMVKYIRSKDEILKEVMNNDVYKSY